MLQNFDLQYVGNFAAVLEARRTRCASHSEGVNCFYLDDAITCHLDGLTRDIQSAERLLRHWISPQVAVGPGPRVMIPRDALEEIRQTLSQRNHGT